MAPGRVMMIVVLAALATPLGCGPSSAWRNLRPHGPHFGDRNHFHFRNRIVPLPGETNLFNYSLPEIYRIPPPVLEEPFPGEESPALPTPSPPPTNFFSEGMAITVKKILDEKSDDSGARPSPIVDRPRQAAELLADCWSPPLPERGDSVEVTIRFSFNSRGEVIGSPRIVYAKAGKGTSVEDVRKSILAAVKDCTPLRFSESMAASAPGYPLAVRFIGQRAEASTEKN